MKNIVQPNSQMEVDCERLGEELMYPGLPTIPRDVDDVDAVDHLVNVPDKSADFYIGEFATV